MTDRSFRENLDLLIKLFRRLKSKSSLAEIQGIDKAFYQNFEYLLNNYEMMKDQISEELLDKFGEPVKGMIAGLVEQLKEELGEDAVNIMEDVKVEENFTNDTNKSLEEIDEMLKKTDLTEEEIDLLLDRRSKLMKQKE
ncbi:MAG: hypothetical protein KKA81_07345 [Bacteroidetes bacterium]|nr:hypothetical protein [Bacteroidota bacterium]